MKAGDYEVLKTKLFFARHNVPLAERVLAEARKAGCASVVVYSALMRVYAMSLAPAASCPSKAYPSGLCGVPRRVRTLGVPRRVRNCLQHSEFREFLRQSEFQSQTKKLAAMLPAVLSGDET